MKTALIEYFVDKAFEVLISEMARLTEFDKDEMTFDEIAKARGHIRRAVRELGFEPI